MSENGADFMAQYQAGVGSRIREQLVRHLSIEPNTDPRRIVEIQIQHERQRLEKVMQESEGKPEVAESLRLIIAWLPELEHKLKGR
jgi:hypothetical protein